jgi:hypothetical protein
MGGSGTVKGGAWLEEVDHWGCILVSHTLPWTLPVTALLCFLSAKRLVALLQHMLPIEPHLRPTTMEPVIHGLKPLKL